MAVFVVASIAVLVTACSSSSSTTPATTTRPKITNAADARNQLDQMEKRGDCLDLQSAYVAMKSAPIALATDPTKEKVDAFRDEVEELRPRIPDAAKADFDVVAKAYDQLITVLNGVDLSDAAKVAQNAPKAREALKALDDPAVKASEQKLDAYFKACAAPAG